MAPEKSLTIREIEKQLNARGNIVIDTSGIEVSAAWADITGKPSTFPPDAHSHAEADVTGLVGDLASKAPLSHVHAGADVTSGTLAIARIPTGTTSSTVAIGNDSRLSDARTPLAHTHAESEVTNLVADLAAKEATASKNAVSGYAGVDGTARIAQAQAPVVVQALGAPAVDVTVVAGYGIFIAEEFVIADGKELLIDDGAEMVIL
jgi:hypothetical protein